MDEQAIQRVISQALNNEYADPWGAFRSTGRDGTEYVELMNSDTLEKFIITIVKGQ
jgi:hypothetical protein